MREKEKEREIHMKLLSINTHSLIEENYEKKVKIFVEAVARIKPDIICMQEVNQTNTAALADDSQGKSVCYSKCNCSIEGR